MRPNFLKFEYNSRILETINDLVAHVEFGVKNSVVDLDEIEVKQDLLSLQRRVVRVAKEHPELGKVCRCLVRRIGKLSL